MWGASGRVRPAFIETAKGRVREGAPCINRNGEGARPGGCAFCVVILGNFFKIHIFTVKV